MIVSLHRVDGRELFKCDAVALIAFWCQVRGIVLPDVIPGELLKVQAVVDRDKNTTAVLDETLAARSAG